MENDLLMHNHHNNYLVVCPSGLRSEILDLSLSQWCSGHFGIFKTRKRVLASFWWPGLYSDIVDFITQCEVCISVKPLNRNPGRMGIRSFPSSPIELVSTDFLVELPITHRGSSRILSINDQFSKFTQLYAVPDLTAATSAKCYCVKSVQIRSYFWSLFSRIRTEYREILCISPYSVRMQENTDQK